MFHQDMDETDIWY